MTGGACVRIIAGMSQDALHSAIQTIRTQIQAELEAQLAAIERQHQDAVDLARTQAREEAEARVAQAAAEADRRVAAETTAARSEAEQKAAESLEQARREAAQQLAVLKALGDETRLRIIGLLAEGGPMPVHALSAGVGLSQPLISWHLRILRLARLIDTQRQPGGRRPWRGAGCRLASHAPTTCGEATRCCRRAPRRRDERCWRPSSAWRWRCT